MKDLEVDASSREDGRRLTFESEFFWGPVLRSDPSIRPKHFGARTSADARDHVAPPSQVSQGAQELRRGDRAREGCDQLLPGTSRPAPNTRRPQVGRISLLSGEPCGTIPNALRAASPAHARPSRRDRSRDHAAAARSVFDRAMTTSRAAAGRG